MLKAVAELVPDFVYSVYYKPSSLFWGDKILQSSEGVQQGDPLGPFLFCLTIHYLTLQLRSEFCVFYLDDGTVGGSMEDVLQDGRRPGPSAEQEEVRGDLCGHYHWKILAGRRSWTPCD